MSKTRFLDLHQVKVIRYRRFKILSLGSQPARLSHTRCEVCIAQVCRVYCTRCVICIVHCVQCVSYRVCSVNFISNLALTLRKRILDSNLRKSNLINFCTIEPLDKSNIKRVYTSHSEHLVRNGVHKQYFFVENISLH